MSADLSFLAEGFPAPSRWVLCLSVRFERWHEEALRDGRVVLRLARGPVPCGARGGGRVAYGPLVERRGDLCVRDRLAVSQGLRKLNNELMGRSSIS